MLLLGDDEPSRRRECGVAERFCGVSGDSLAVTPDRTS